MADPPLRFVAYCRQSERQAGEDARSSLSLASQEEAFRAWCSDNNAVPVAVCRDHDLRGWDAHRPGIAELLEIAERERVDGVWVLSLSRFARDHVLQELIWRDLQARGVRFLTSATEHGTGDDLIRGILGLMHAKSRKEQSAHLRNAFALRAVRGAFPNGPAPFGYKRPQTIIGTRSDGTVYSRQTGEPVIDEEQADRIRSWCARILAGETIAGITRDLNAARVPAPRGGHWRSKTVRDILTSPILTGDIEHCGRVVAHNNAYAIIDQETFRAVGERLQRTAVIRGDRPTSWAAGFVLHACGRRMYEQIDRRDGNMKFVCQGQWEETCTLARRIVSRRMIEAAAWQAITQDVSRVRTVPDAIRVAAERAGGTDVARSRRALDKRAEAATTRHGRMLDRFGEGKLSVERMDDEDARLRDELAAIDRERNALPHAPDVDGIARAVASLGRLADRLVIFGDPEKRALLAEIGVVIVSETGVTIRYHAPYDVLFQPSVVPVPKWGRGLR